MAREIRKARRQKDDAARRGWSDKGLNRRIGRSVKKSPGGRALIGEFLRLADSHERAVRARFARAVLGGSVIRVFAKGTKPGLLRVLANLPVEELAGLSSGEFEQWYRRQLGRVAREVARLNRANMRVQPGLKWGHSAKVLSLYLRDIVEHTRLFSAKEVRRITPWLYAPIDSIVIHRLQKLGVELPFSQIQEIDSFQKFECAQSALAVAARRAKVPRVWFDDNWAER